MIETSDIYTSQIVSETKRLIHTLIDELLVEENSIVSLADRLIAESEDGSYRECYEAMKKVVEAGGAFFRYLNTTPQYKNLFVHGAIDTLIEAENDGSLADITKMLVLYQTVKMQLGE